MEDYYTALANHWIPFFTDALGHSYRETIVALYDRKLGNVSQNPILLTLALARADMLGKDAVKKILRDLGAPGLIACFPKPFTMPKPTAHGKTFTVEDEAMFKTLLFEKGSRAESTQELEVRWKPVFMLLSPNDCAALVQEKRLQMYGTAIPTLLIRSLFAQGFLSLRENQWEQVPSLLKGIGREDIANKLLGVTQLPLTTPSFGDILSAHRQQVSKRSHQAGLS